MSKITPKNLHYDSTLPPFLQRLQSQNTNQDRRQDFHPARPKKPRDEDADREDEPVYFDEASGETLTRGEWEEREKFSGEGGKALEADGEDAKATEDVLGGGKDGAKDVEARGEKERVAAIGGARKRKAGKIVGSTGEEGDESDPGGLEKKKVSTTEKKKTGSAKAEGKKPEKSAKAAKKGKKIKLSFGDDE